jgi:hypothetical protein
VSEKTYTLEEVREAFCYAFADVKITPDDLIEIWDDFKRGLESNDDEAKDSE